MLQRMAQGDTDQSAEEELMLALQNKSVWQKILFYTYRILWEVLHPHSTFRTAFDLIIIVLLLWVCFMGPYVLCFQIITQWPHPFSVMATLIDIMFTVDIYLNFRTGFIEDNAVFINNRWLIAKAYLTGWFFIDVVSVLPFDLLTELSLGEQRAQQVGNATRLLRILKLLRLTKILRVLRASQSFGEMMAVRFGRALTRIASFVLGGVVLLHLWACFFYYVARMQEDGNSSVETWTQVTQGLEDADNFAFYVTSLYWAMSTMTTVGYGDVTPQTPLEKIFASFSMLVGATIFAYFMGSVSNLLQAVNASKARVTAKQASVDDFLRVRSVPKSLAERIRNYYTYMASRDLQANDLEILQGLPRGLQQQVVMAIHKKTLDKIQFFKDKHPQFIVQVVMHFKLQIYIPGEFIVSQGERGDAMFFIIGGKLQVRVYTETIQESDLESNAERRSAPWVSNYHNIEEEESDQSRFKVVGTLHAGHQFGEYSCLTREPRSASVIAQEFSEVYSLSRKDLLQTIEEWPELQDEFYLFEQQQHESLPSSYKHFSTKQLQKFNTLSKANRGAFKDKRPKQDFVQRGQQQNDYRILSQELPSYPNSNRSDVAEKQSRVGWVDEDR